MIVTLSPSKGQDFDAPIGRHPYTLPQQLDHSAELVDALRQYDVQGIQALMSVSENIADLNVTRFKDFTTPFTPDNARQALYAFKGDVYSTIEVDDYGDDDLAFAQAHLRILSGLYGYLRPLDLIQPYRLEMKTRLENPRGANLYAFWGERITELLNRDLAEQAEPVLVNLASNEYFKSIKPGKLAGRLLQVNFKETKAGKTRVVAIFAKRARGMMANWIIRNRLESSADLKAFALEGYRFDAGLSDEGQLTFTRPQP